RGRGPHRHRKERRVAPRRVRPPRARRASRRARAGLVMCRGRDREWRLICAAVFALLIPLFTGAARADISVRATVNPQRAQVGEPLTLTIDINGTQSVPAPAITIDGFDARYVGPSTQISIVNGQMNTSIQHRYSLLPLQPGRFTVGPFSIDYQGQHYQTASLT